MAKTMLFNPYTGRPRDPRDIQSDPEGILVLDPDEPLRAYAPPAADAVSVDSLMEMAQEYASAWSLVGGPLDRGDMLDDAADAKERLRRAIAAALAARGES